MDLEGRIQRLEERASPGRAPFAVQWGERAIKVRGERLTREAFFERYPEGDLICIDSSTPPPPEVSHLL